VPCRARFDALSPYISGHGVFAIDLKTTEDATKEGFERSVAKWGYDVQVAHYEATFTASEGMALDRFVFVAVEKSAPYEVAMFELPDVWLEMGRAKAKAARTIFAECIASGEWPGYTTDIQILDPPTWLVFAHEMKYEYGEINV
jgi:exodeoxyribonuclease VIII